LILFFYTGRDLDGDVTGEVDPTLRTTGGGG
jgi:hypothetical protein